MFRRKRPKYCEVMRRSVHLLEGAKFFIFVALLSVALRALASIGRPIARFPDSTGYESFQLFGQIDRMWSITLIYSFFDSDFSRVAFQILIGAIVWIWLAVVVSRLTRFSRTGFVLVLVLGLSPQIIRYDLAILSESLGISFAVFAFAMSLHIIASSSPLGQGLWIISVALCVMTRPTHLLVVAVILVPFCFRLFTKRGRRLSFTAISLFFIGFLGVVQTQANSSTSLLNFYTVLAERVITSDQRYEWFVANGMPNIDGAREAYGYDYAVELPADVEAIVQLPVGQQPPTLMRVGGVSLAQWAKKDGWKTYLAYIANHPKDTTTRLESLMSPTLSPPNGDFLPLENGPMLPDFMFGPWQLWGLALAVGTGIALLRKNSRRLGQVLFASASIVIVVYVATSLASGIEHPRHGATVAAMLRVVGLVAVLAALSRSSASTDHDALDGAPS